MNHSTEAASSLEFFKVFLPDSGTLHMSIPPAFVKHLIGTFPKKATIIDHIGKSWCVTLEKLDGVLCFKNGWQAFVDYHFLKYGDFLIFKYDGHCTFDVKIFGKNGCKKAVVVEAAHSVPVVEAVVVEAGNSIPVVEAVVAEAGNSIPVVEAVVAEAGNYVPILDAVVADVGYSLPILKVKEEPMVEIEKEDVQPLVSSKRKQLQVGSVTIHKRRKAPKRGKPRNTSNSSEYVAPEGPFFERTMKRWSNKTVYISGRVVRDQNISLKQNIVLRDEEGKLWPARVCNTSQSRISVTAGWSKFYKSHKLRVNDKCQFEFVLERGNLCRQLNVKITRRCLALR